MRGVLALLLGLAAGPAPAWEPLNAFRAEHGLDALERSEVLQEVAEGHARDMAAKDYFAHEGPGGETLTDRAMAAGYGYCRIAENIAKGQETAEAVFEGWRGSPPHRENMLLPDLTDYGLARASGDYWVLVLGRPGC